MHKMRSWKTIILQCTRKTECWPLLNAQFTKWTKEFFFNWNLLFSWFSFCLRECSWSYEWRFAYAAQLTTTIILIIIICHSVFRLIPSKILDAPLISISISLMKIRTFWNLQYWVGWLTRAIEPIWSPLHQVHTIILKSRMSFDFIDGFNQLHTNFNGMNNLIETHFSWFRERYLHQCNRCDWLRAKYSFRLISTTNQICIRHSKHENRIITDECKWQIQSWTRTIQFGFSFSHSVSEIEWIETKCQILVDRSFVHCKWQFDERSGQNFNFK